MRKTYARTTRLVDRLEKKYQKKLQTQKYKMNNRNVKHVLSSASGITADDLDYLPPELQDFGGYEYVSRKR